MELYWWPEQKTDEEESADKETQIQNKTDE
jgi:hypothetical protein